MTQNKKYEYSSEDLKNYMALPLKKKLALLEEMNNFFDRLMPAKSKKIWQQMKKKGF